MIIMGKINIEKIASLPLSRQLYADYKPFSLVDGEGVRCAIFVSGCIFNCKGCYNKSIQDFSNGKVLTDEIIDGIIEDIKEPYCQGLTLLGGEPFLNTDTCLRIVERFRNEFGNEKDIWCWTGYTWEELQESIKCNALNSYKQQQLLSEVDVLVDGRYIDEQKDTTGTIKFRGSWNQRIIDVKETVKQGQIILLEKYM